MKKKTVITLLFVLPIFVNCQNIENTKTANLEIESMSFDQNKQPDIRGIITYDKYQVVVANGNETVLEIAKRLGLDPRKFSLFNGLVESYRPRQGELLALNKNLDQIEEINSNVWSQETAKNVLEKVKEKKKISAAPKDLAKHKVEAGETIYSIARLYSVSVTSLAKLNSLDAEFTIYVGQLLFIPISQKNIKLSKKNVKPARENINPNKNNSQSPSNNEQIGNSEIKFLRPVKGKIINKYNPNSEKRKNQGIDFQVLPGSHVYAVSDGKVALVTDNTENFGKIVLIRHEDNLISIYGRVAKVLVKKNEPVKKGQKIGSMIEKTKDGQNFTILHFEIRKGTKSVNPENYFKDK
ncbi:LysM peptidoglycan-binding domain-containing M23 family metallopeptidase [Paracoccaceae bacterium]|nr:LysM peptidoglycan-binding domain-containing M23 family metallopeptidase [Paracoccaceae bacterium]